MADTTLQAESACENTELEILYAAWRHAKASWEVAQYAPENVGNDLPDEIDRSFCEMTCDALNAFLLHPAKDSSELLRKLRVFRDEEIYAGWYKAPLIVEQLVQDARTAAFGGDA